MEKSPYPEKIKNSSQMAKSEEKIVCRNREAGRLYQLEERFEAGMALLGSEVKSLREGRANLKDAYARFEGRELYLVQAHIAPYFQAGIFNHNPERARKLLLNKRELKRLLGKVTERGYTIIPLKIYFKKGRAKLEIALAKGKKVYDRREEIKKRDLEREMRREAKYRRS